VTQGDDLPSAEDYTVASVMVAMFSGVHTLLVLLEGILLMQNPFFQNSSPMCKCHGLMVLDHCGEFNNDAKQTLGIRKTNSSFVTCSWYQMHIMC